MQHNFSNRSITATRDDDEDDIDVVESAAVVRPQQKTGFTRAFQSRVHNFYLYKGIGAPEKYTELIHTIRTADPGDHIFIHLNTPGGHLDTGISLLSAFAECQGTITTVLDGTACSMGAILFLAGHQYVVHDFTMLMFHTFSGGFSGKSGDVDKQVQAYKRQYSSIVKKVCSKFLTNDEIRRIDAGEEMWFSSDVILKRLKSIEKSFNEPPISRSARKIKQATPVEDAIE